MRATVRIITGDCREVLASLPEASVDCVLTDPPYGETSLIWDQRVPGWPALVRRLLKPTGSLWVFGSLRSLIETSTDFVGWNLSHDVIWEKHNGTGLFNDRFRRVHEIAAHFYPDDRKWSDIFKAPQFTNDATAQTVRRKGRPAQWIGATGETVYRSEDGGPRLRRSVIYTRSEHGRAEHPTQKPVALLEPLLRYACPPGGHVIDPFGGSGSTGLAAKLIGVDCTLIELNPAYVEMARRRIRDDVPLLREAAE
jgi:site-specific DNA-methyltransferase (adenine-specific)